MSTIFFFQGTRILICPRFKDQINIGRYKYKKTYYGTLEKSPLPHNSTSWDSKRIYF